jgi:signal transduction histidine kinase
LSGRLREYAGFITALFTVNDEIKQPANLNELIMKSIEDTKEELDCTRIKIYKDSPRNFLLECFPKQLRYAINQILKNAVEAMPEGGDLKIGVALAESAVVITVRDTGKGIPKENIDMIFMPLFTRTKIYGGKGGSIAHKIICENHEGSIAVESLTAPMVEAGAYPGKSRGTAITITLPM